MQSLDSKAALELLAASAADLISYQRFSNLDRKHLKSINDGRRVLCSTAKSLTDKRRAYRTFLEGVHGESGRVALLLCMVGIGQKRLWRMKAGERREFREKLKLRICSTPFDSRVLQSIAQDAELLPEGCMKALASCVQRRQCQLTLVAEGRPSLSENIPTSPTDKDGASRQQTGEDVWPLRQRDIRGGAIVSPNKQQATTSQGEALRYASMAGATAVFGERICDTFANVTTQRGDKDMRASITMEFPEWGIVDCLLSMHICKSAVSPLAKELFGAEVAWLDDSIHATLQEGLTIIVPGTELTLKGTEEAIILDIFGPEPLNAIKATPIRGEEVRQGKSKTECVSMILTGDGAVINLALGLEGGMQIQKKLDL